MINRLEENLSSGISFDDFDFLNQELEKTWNMFSIPTYHREIFSKYLILLSPSLIPVFIAQEIDRLETGKSPTVRILERINEREYLIGKLKNLNEESKKSKSKESNVLDLECANLIIRLREVTIKVIDSILAWKKIFNRIDCQFYWNQICYMEKIKHDLDFLTKLGKFVFNSRDPFFSSTDLALISKKAKIMLKPTIKQERKIKKLEKVLSYGIGNLPNIGLSIAKSATIPEADKVFALRIPTRKEIVQIEQENAIMSFQILDSFLTIVLAEISQSSIDYEYNQQNINWISSSIFDSYINEISLQDSSEIFLAFLLDKSEDTAELYVEECITNEVHTCLALDELLVILISCDFLDSVNFAGIVKISVNEIREENERLVEPVLDFIYSELLKQEWVQEAISTVITSEKKREASGYKTSNDLDNDLDLPSQLYFSLVHEYVGGIWIESIIKSSFKEIRGNDEAKITKLMPILSKKNK